MAFTDTGTPQEEPAWGWKESTCPSLSAGVVVWEIIVRAGLASGGLSHTPNFTLGPTEARTEKGLAG